ncbi:MAG: hypothetical protein IJY71_07755 [Clostridia bacterium]|nr:hypothetical protein [Clostridia bacterium]
MGKKDRQPTIFAASGNIRQKTATEKENLLNDGRGGKYCNGQKKYFALAKKRKSVYNRGDYKRKGYNDKQ